MKADDDDDDGEGRGRGRGEGEKTQLLNGQRLFCAAREAVKGRRKVLLLAV